MLSWKLQNLEFPDFATWHTSVLETRPHFHGCMIVRKASTMRDSANVLNPLVWMAHESCRRALSSDFCTVQVYLSVNLSTELAFSINVDANVWLNSVNQRAMRVDTNHFLTYVCLLSCHVTQTWFQFRWSYFRVTVLCEGLGTKNVQFTFRLVLVI